MLQKKAVPLREHSLNGTREYRALPYALSETRYGRMLYHERDIYVGQSFARYGEYGELELQLLRVLVRPGDVIVEAGANIGADTVPLARQVGENGLVFAFEPQRLVYQMLCANVALNGLSNVIAYWAAIGERAGTVRMPVVDYHAQFNFGGVSILNGSTGDPVMAVTIDSFQLSRCTLIKADVEGMEKQVILGAAETIRRLRPRLYLENNGGEDSSALIELLLSLRYRLYWHTPPLFNPANFAKHTDNVFPGIVSTNMLCVPEEDKAKVAGLRVVSGPQDTALPSQRPPQ